MKPPAVLSRGEALVLCAGAAALSLALFPGALLRGEALYERDIPYDWYPQVEAFVGSLARGSWPVWDPGVAFGQPLLADPSAQVAYPFAWLRLVLLPWTYYTVFVVSHLSWSAVGAFLLARRLRVSSAGALCAAGLWAASGPLLSMVNLWHHFTGAAWMPWVLLAAVAVWEAPGRGSLLRFAAVFALQALGGSADMCLLTLFVALGLAWLRRAPSLRPALHVAGGLLLACALAAVQWLPTAAAARASARVDLGAAMRTDWSATPHDLVQALVPISLADLPLRPEVMKALLPYGEPFLASLYLSAPAIALVLTGLALGPRGLVTRLAVLGGLAFLIALGASGHLYPLLARLLPPVRMLRYPVKAMVVPALCWSLLAGVGFDAWRGEAPRAGGVLLRVATLTGLVAALCLAVAWFALDPRGLRSLFVAGADPGPEILALGLRPLVSGSLALCAAVAAALAGRSRLPWRGAAAVSVVSLVDLVFAHGSLNPTIPHQLLAFRPPVLEDLRTSDRSRSYVYDYSMIAGSSRKHLGRDDPYVLVRRPGLPLRVQQVLSQRLYPFPPSAARWGVEGSYDFDVRGMYPSWLDRLSRLFTAVDGTPAQLRLLRIGAVSRLVALHARGLEDLVPLATRPSLFPEPVRVYAVPYPLPRSYAVGTARVARDEDALGLLLDPAVDPAHEILVPPGAAPAEAPSFSGRCRIAALEPDRVIVESEMSAPGFVVIVDSYDPGWRASVDGRPAPLLRANVAFRAVPAPAGRHRIEMVYRPGPVRWGLLVSAAASVVALLLAFGPLPGPIRAPGRGGAP